MRYYFGISSPACHGHLSCGHIVCGTNCLPSLVDPQDTERYYLQSGLTADVKQDIDLRQGTFSIAADAGAVHFVAVRHGPACHGRNSCGHISGQQNSRLCGSILEMSKPGIVKDESLIDTPG